MLRKEFELICILSGAILVASLVPSGKCFPMASGAISRGLTIYRATVDLDTYKKEPTNYEPLALRLLGIELVYVERIPALDIPLREVKTVLIRKERIPRNSKEREEMIREELGERPRQPVPQDLPPEHYYYHASFVLNEKGARTITRFSRENLNQLFVLSLRSQPFAVGTILQPLTGDSFSVDLFEKDVDQLRNIFLPLKDKLIWE